LYKIVNEGSEKYVVFPPLEEPVSVYRHFEYYNQNITPITTVNVTNLCGLSTEYLPAYFTSKTTKQIPLKFGIGASATICVRRM